MNKKEILDIITQHEDIKREIKKLESRLEKTKKLSITVSDVVQNGYKKHAVIHGVDLKRQNKIESLENILQERYDKLLETQTKIEKFLNELESDIRQILEHRYIDNMSWIQIQIAMRL
jgi:molecular chaperone GrpE (heat shock protein)